MTEIKALMPAVGYRAVYALRGRPNNIRHERVVAWAVVLEGTIESVRPLVWMPTLDQLAPATDAENFLTVLHEDDLEEQGPALAADAEALLG